MFPALWIPDLFMKRAEQNGDWTLFSPNEAPGLADVYGDEFEELYTKYEKENRGRQTIKAQKLWYAILGAQTETGTPFMLYKDSCNNKSNQKNLVLSNLPTCVVKLLNILLQMKLLFVTWLPLPCHHLLKMMKKYLVQL